MSQDPRNVTITVTFDVDSHAFTLSGPDCDPDGNLQPPIGVVSVYLFELTTTPPDSAVSPVPITITTQTSWLSLTDNWVLTVDGTNLEASDAASYRISVAFQGATFVHDPTIVMVDPPTPVPGAAVGGDRPAAVAAT